MTSPAVLKPVSVATLVIARCGFCEPGVVTSSHAFAAPPAPTSAQDSSELQSPSASVCRLVRVDEHVNDAPGARSEPFVVVHPISSASASLTDTSTLSLHDALPISML